MSEKVEELKKKAVNGGFYGIVFAVLALVEQLQENEKNTERRHEELLKVMERCA
ncbi:MAG: hypothetical protein WC878_05325 [Candidatus Paceibacterota bacterium]|jgi:hypothetical protein